MGMIGNSPALGIVTPAQLSDAELQSLAAMSPSRATYLAGTEGFGFRNRIINGDMRIDQRNNGAALTNDASGAQFPVDRFLMYGAVVSKFTAQRNAGAISPPVGYTNYLGATSSSAYAVGAGENFRFEHRIEGLNVADFGFGTANATAFTVSFWVRSSLTGTFGGAVANGAFTRSYPFTFSIVSANTWEQKTVTVAGDTSGTWLTTNGTGLRLIFSLGSGSTYSGAAGVWASTAYTSATGATSVVGTNGATFYITGVQLEAGTVATPFERRDYGRELMMCQRYCMVYWTAVDGSVRAFGFSLSSTSGVAQFYFPVTTRVPPSGATVSAASTFTLYTGASGLSPSSITFDNASTKTANVTVTASGQSGGGGIILAMQSANNKIEFTGMEL